MNRADVASAVLQSRHLTIRSPAATPVEEAAAATFADLATRMRTQGVLPIQEKIYGPLAHKQSVLGIRREALLSAGLDPDVPCSYTSGRRDDDLGLAGVQLWGFTAREGAPVRVRTVHSRAGTAGRLLEAPEFRLLHLFGVHGDPDDARRPQGVADQAARMYENADAALAEHGFGFEQVTRTWVYITRLLDWYGEFNRVRTAFLRARGITDDALFPASTGIQGMHGAGECVMDVLAVDGGRVQAITDSSRQRRPMSYGSSFSRGLRLRWGDEDTLFVSGTASIDALGQTLHCWQREAQIIETLLSIAALLEDQGAGLRDVRLATLFCKDRETLKVYERVTRQLGITDLPVIPVLADVCRPELMVEIEALAVVPAHPAEDSDG